MQDSILKWNFHKYLVDERGQVEHSIPSGVLPIDDEIVNWING
jgi:glutathione peroxidase